MIASHWERNLSGLEKVTIFELAGIDERFLIRYTDADKSKVLEMLNEIRRNARNA